MIAGLSWVLLSGHDQDTRRHDLALTVERDGPGLQLKWADSPLVRAAGRGLVVIRDGPSETRLHLDAGQLSLGNLAYRPKSDDVRFRMEVYAAGDRVSESIVASSHGGSGSAVIGEARSPQPVLQSSSAPEPRQVAQKEKRPRIAQRQEADRVQRFTPRTGNLNTDTRQAQAKPEAAVVMDKPSPRGPAAGESQPSTVDTASIAPPHAVSPGRETALALESSDRRPAERKRTRPAIATVSHEPVPPNVVRRTLARIPGLRRLQRNTYRAGENFTPARPIRRVTPTVPTSVTQDVAEHAVDLKVTVEKDGSISTTELISNQDNPRLVALAAEAASRWRFEPAKLREKPIPSEVILHFRFKRGSEAVQ
jgi:hypothetical protein